MAASVLLYVQHLLGIGHVKRSLRVAGALAEEGVEVTIVSGGEPLGEEIGAVFKRVVQLIPVKANDATFKHLVGPAGRPIDESLRMARRTALLDAFASARPDAVVIEAFPFGRRAFRFELDPLIEAARSRRPRALVLCSLRDIVIVSGDPNRQCEIADRVRADFDYVLVHGDPAFIPLETSFPAASQIADRLLYTGYVAGSDQAEIADEAAGTDEVLVSVGGGAVGGALLSTALEARRNGCLASLVWRLLAGPNLPDQAFGAIAQNLPEGVVLERFRPEFAKMLRRCRVSVSQGGYNTILDILAAGVRAVVVPFAAERETEQQLRAEQLAARGVLKLVPEAELSPARLAAAIEHAVEDAPQRIRIDMGGARRTASLIADMVRRR
jgi:predicted glycosyltransferase